MKKTTYFWCVNCIHYVYALDVCRFVIDLVFIFFLNTYLELINLSKSIRFILNTEPLLSLTTFWNIILFEKCPLISVVTWSNILSVMVFKYSMDFDWDLKLNLAFFLLIFNFDIFSILFFFKYTKVSELKCKAESVCCLWLVKLF